MGAIGDFAKGLIEPIAGLISEVIPDTDKRDEIAFKLATLAGDRHQSLMMAQIAVNKADAESGKFWQSGWRPFFGWAGGMAFVNNFILIPWAQAAGLDIIPMDWQTMSPVVMGILGLGGARTVEKVKGKA
jgi:hypothetical protein